MNAKLSVLGVAFILAGCATVSPERAALMNPARIDASADASYYNAALTQLRSRTSATPATVESLVDEGITLNEAYCRDWLRRIDDTQRQFDAGRQNVNVLTSLATAGLGIAHATSALVAGYGAGLTAFNGLADNFSASTFIAPSTQQVGVRVMELLEQYGNQLRADAPNLTFPRARARLGIHGDLCSFSSIRALVNGSLAQTQATVTPVGSVVTVATPAAVAAANVTSAFAKDDSGARLIHFWMPGGTVNAANEAKIKGWMEKNGVQVSIPFAAHSALYGAARAKAVADLQIPAAP